MRREIIDYLNTRPDLKFFIREQPRWYRDLSRNPLLLEVMESEANVFFGRTFGQRIDKFHNQVKTVGLMIDFLSMIGKGEDL
ncbi:YlbE-like family protein [Fictibacillus sp. WQ 8-8]|uniref:YlbE-like family protein n=1 Tax=Fictibacillus sp. WQ 8-8 TaxID=2938788 RepID=UPI00210D0D88|nr:YlbE-like family protein [Fictibacillus sp. WQ 8-8]MCQ6265668.1 YlbE-like family protein [Fictibacillus sp. WQ 8-8]